MLVSRDGEVRVNTIDLNEELYVIVQFKDTPLLLQKKRERMSPGSIEARFGQFEADLARLQAKVAPHLAPEAPTYQILRRFSKIYCGVSLKASRGLVQTLHGLPYVKSIREVKKVYAHLNESVGLIGADSVWSHYGVMGDSIVVGVLDTGIDYTHPALGNGFGPGFKVIGGYDVANQDEDPMDGVGHGTHVAGIVAADGDSIRGVAPRALLMAFKVLTDEGWGWEDWILEGIERAVDPDGDPNTDDAVDIINLSLGGRGDPDDPLSTAVDGAVELGVVCVISAGNNFNYNSIGSPGTARAAITVGATDKSDQIAYFSSRGPNKITYGIKPDLVAPGVDILSCDLGGGFVKHDGTSMSAPHVAGVAALLLDLYRDWTPAMIKSALMSQGVDIGEDVFTQGAGRVDALASAGVATLTNPASLSFGLDDVTQDLWTVTDTLNVINVDSLLQDYVIQFSGMLEGLSLSADPAGFTLLPGGEQSVVIELLVDNILLSWPEEYPPSYEGALTIGGTSDTLNIPWALLKASVVRLTFDSPRPGVFISSNEYAITDVDLTWEAGNTVAEGILPRGIYDIVTHYYGLTTNRYVFWENMLIEGFLDTLISSSEAIHAITTWDLDEGGNPLGGGDELNSHQNIILTFPDSSYFRAYSLGSPISDTVMTSDFSSDFELQVVHRRVIQGKFYVMSHSIEGLVIDTALVNDPFSYVSQALNFQFNPNMGNYFLTFLDGIHVKRDEIEFGFLFGQIEPYYPVENPDSIQAFLTNRIARKEVGYITALDGWDIDLYNFEDVIRGYYFFSRPFYVTEGDSVANSWWVPPKKIDVVSPTGGQMFFGGSAPFCYSYNLNNYFGNLSIMNYPYPTGQANEVRYSDLFKSRYWIMQDTTVLTTDTLWNIEPFTVQSPALYTFMVENPNYYLDQLQGQSQLWMTFDLGQDDPNSPTLTSFKIKNDEHQVTSQLDLDETAIVELTAADFIVEDWMLGYFGYQDVAQVGLYYKLFDGEDWGEIPLVESQADFDSSYGRFFTADLTPITSQYPESTVVDLKVFVSDFSGNITEQIFHPAFKIGNVIITGVEGERMQAEIGIPLAFALDQNYPNPFNPETVIRYHLPQASKVVLKIYNILGEEVKILVDVHQVAGSYTISWDGRNQLGKPVASGIYFCRITSGPAGDNFAGYDQRNFTRVRKMVLLR